MTDQSFPKRIWVRAYVKDMDGLVKTFVLEPFRATVLKRIESSPGLYLFSWRSDQGLFGVSWSETECSPMNALDLLADSIRE